LVAAVETAARAVRAPWLYLYTESATGLYEKIGWRVIGSRLVNGRSVELMARRLVPVEDDRSEAEWLSTLRPSRIREVQAGATHWTSADLIDCGSGHEASTIRAVLETMGVRVDLIRVGQARHLHRALASASAPWLILCGHGDDGRLLLPELDPHVERFQPWRHSAGAEELTACLVRRHRSVIATGCGMGNDEMAAAFISAGAEAYLAPTGAPFGYASVMVVASLLYDLVSGRDVRAAAARITAVDDELSMWNLWEAPAQGKAGQ
jgi:hypothetical protein